MSYGKNSGLSTGTSGSPQETFENTEASHKARENEHQLYLEVELPKTSPIPIPKDASITETHKKADYDQVSYRWKDSDYSYEARCHIHTPNALEYSRKTWVISRKRLGIGTGKNHRPKICDVLIDRKGCVAYEHWQEAQIARRLGKGPKEQNELLDNGIGKLKNNATFYKGFEDEPEIELYLFEEPKFNIHIWEGYFHDIFGKPPLDGKGWSGFTYDYQHEERTYKSQKVKIDITEYLNDLYIYSDRNFQFVETYECYKLLYDFLEYAKSENKTVIVNWW